MRKAGLMVASLIVAGWADATCPPELGVVKDKTTWNGFGNGDAAVYDMVVDRSGNVVTSGFEVSATGGENWRIRKYDSMLTMLSTTDYSSPGNAYDAATALAVDSSGSIFVAGLETAGGDGYWRVNKYDAALTTLLSTTLYKGPTSLNDWPNDMVVDGSGNVVVVGQEYVGSSGHWRLRKYNSDLTALLSTTDYIEPTGGSANCYGVAVDASGNVVVAGMARTSTGNYDWRIAKYDIGLASLLSATTYAGTGNGYDAAYDVKLDGSGQVYVAGSDFDATGADNLRVRKYDSGLTTLLADATYNGPANGSDYAEAVLLEANGNVLVCGGEAAAGGDNAIVRRYSPELTTVLSSISYNGAGNGYDDAIAVAVGAGGNVYVAGTETDSGGYHDGFVFRYECPDLPAVTAGEGTTIAYPNPVAGDRVTLALGLKSDATEVEVAVFNIGMQRVRREVFPSVAASWGQVVLDGMGKLAPGVYLVRATATYADGSKQTFPVRKLVVKR